MLQKLKTHLVTVAGITALLVPLVFAGTVSATGVGGNVGNGLTGQACKGINQASNPSNPISLNPTGGADATSCTGDTSAGGTLGNIINTVINVFSIVVGAVSVIMIIFGGFRYITSGGNDTSIAGAKNTIVYALIGLVIVVLAQVIVHYLITRLGNAGTG